MSIQSSGLLKLTCNICGKLHAFNASNLEWQCQEKPDEKEKTENIFKTFLLKRCDCTNRITVNFKAVERPNNEFEPLEYTCTIDGCKIDYEEFKLYAF
jgi:hypothetical protein